VAEAKEGAETEVGETKKEDGEDDEGKLMAAAKAIAQLEEKAKKDKEIIRRKLAELAARKETQRKQLEEKAARESASAPKAKKNKRKREKETEGFKNPSNTPFRGAARGQSRSQKARPRHGFEPMLSDFLGTGGANTAMTPAEGDCDADSFVGASPAEAGANDPSSAAVLPKQSSECSAWPRQRLLDRHQRVNQVGSSYSQVLEEVLKVVLSQELSKKSLLPMLPPP